MPYRRRHPKIRMYLRGIGLAEIRERRSRLIYRLLDRHLGRFFSRLDEQPGAFAFSKNVYALAHLMCRLGPTVDSGENTGVAAMAMKAAAEAGDDHMTFRLQIAFLAGYEAQTMKTNAWIKMLERSYFGDSTPADEHIDMAHVREVLRREQDAQSARSRGGIASAKVRRKDSEQEVARAAAAYQKEVKLTAGTKTAGIMAAHSEVGTPISTLWSWHKKGLLTKRPPTG